MTLHYFEGWNGEAAEFYPPAPYGTTKQSTKIAYNIAALKKIEASGFDGFNKDEQGLLQRALNSAPAPV